MTIAKMGEGDILQKKSLETEILQVIRSVVEDLGNDRAARAVALDARLDRDLGLASLERVELLLRIEKRFGVTLADGAIMTAETPADVAHAVMESRLSSVDRGEGAVLVDHPDRPSAVRMITDVPAATLIGVLKGRAEADPLGPHIYLREGKREGERVIRFGALWSAAVAAATSLQRKGLVKGDTVALMLRTEEPFFSTFMGILLAGGIPVPVYPPPRPERIAEYSARQVRILNSAEARFIVTFQDATALARLLRPRISSLKGVLTPSDLQADSLLDERRLTEMPTAAGSDSALIQYTSGSTGDPKGVHLTHTNLLSNIRCVGKTIHVSPSDIGVSWLPLYHDMGLIGSWLFCLVYGIPVVLMSPLTFLSRPERWFRAIHEHRATLSPAPNFAYELCARKIADKNLEGLDLSSWRIAFNGAEPVSPETIDRFTDRFARYGFRRESLVPVYGLAECSVALTIPPLDRPARIDAVDRVSLETEGVAQPGGEAADTVRIVSCGRPLPEHSLRIVDPKGKPVEDRVVGRLEFMGPSMMSGYYRNAAATAEVYHQGWIDSGDLAYCSEGEVYVTGRRKDMIVKGGRNLYPQEVEEVVGDIPGVRRGFVAAFGVSDPNTGTERIIVVCETRETNHDRRDGLISDVMDKVGSVLGVPPDLVVLSPPGSVPKTSSGKIRRDACRRLFLDDRLTRRPKPLQLQVIGLALAAVGTRIRNAIYLSFRHLYGIYGRVVFFITGLPVWLILFVVTDVKVARSIGRWWSKLFLRLIACPIVVEGRRESLVMHGGVFVANHAGELDAAVLMSILPSSCRFVAKREVMNMPLVRTFIRKAGYLTVDRSDPFRAWSADDLNESLIKGVSVAFFPEGTYTRTAGLRAFALGAFKVSVETGRPVVPIGIRGTRVIYQEGRWPPKPGRIRVCIGKPIHPTGEGWKEMVRLRDSARMEVAHLSAERLLDVVLPGIVTDRAVG